MRTDKLTTAFQQVLSDAQSLAVGYDSPTMEPLHVLSALLAQEQGATKSLLSRAGVNTQRLQQSVNSALESLPKITNPEGQVTVGSELAKLLNLTDRDAQRRGDQFIASELFLLVLADDKGPAGKLLRESGLTRKNMELAIDAVRGGQAVDTAEAEGQRESLKKYCVDLTQRAGQGKLDPVIGRDDEIRRCIQILQRRTKNNPVLIGEPGVGPANCEW